MRLTLLFHIDKMSSVRGDNWSRGRVDETTRYDSQQHENTRNHIKAVHHLPKDTASSMSPPSHPPTFSPGRPRHGHPQCPQAQSNSPARQGSSASRSPACIPKGADKQASRGEEDLFLWCTTRLLLPPWSSWGLATGRGSSSSGTCSSVILLPHENQWYFNLKCKTNNHVEAIVAPQNGRIVCGHQLLPGNETNARRARWPHVALSTLDSLQPLFQEHRA